MHYVIKQCQTCWLSLNEVLVRIIEQYQNLKKYFLKTLPILPGFKAKNGVNQTERYQKIKNVLTSKTALGYMMFIVHCPCSLSFIVHCQDFKEVVHLQSTELKIKVLYTRFVELVKDLLSIIHEKWFFHETDEAATKGRNDPSHQSRRKMQGLSCIF